MKTRSFIYTEAKRTVRRTYGGSNYTLHIYEITGGKLVRVGEVSACTAGHKGEASEAWGVILEKFPRLRSTLIHRAKEAKNDYLQKEAERASYYAYQFRELGVSLESA